MTLAEFLRSRIAEDEALAASARRQWADVRTRWLPIDPRTIARIRVECETKWQIIHQAAALEYLGAMGDPSSGILRALASPYADHPDYLEEWRP